MQWFSPRTPSCCQRLHVLTWCLLDVSHALPSLSLLLLSNSHQGVLFLASVELPSTVRYLTGSKPSTNSLIQLSISFLRSQLFFGTSFFNHPRQPYNCSSSDVIINNNDGFSSELLDEIREATIYEVDGTMIDMCSPIVLASCAPLVYSALPVCLWCVRSCVARQARV